MHAPRTGTPARQPAPPEQATRRAPGREPAAPHAPDGEHGALLRMQRLAGNAATAALVQRTVAQREEAPAGEPAARPGAALTPEQRAQLVYAATVLREVPPVAPEDKAQIGKAISASPVYHAIRQRDTKRGQLARRTAELEQWRFEITQPPPEHGVPPSQFMINEAAADVQRLTTEVADLDKRIKAGLAEAGVATEAELAAVVAERFPTLFFERGKQIVLTELARNKRIVEEESTRYGLDACVDPAARQSLVAAARDLVGRDDRLGELDREIARLRLAVDLPSGGVPDPRTVGSSYRDLMARQAERERLAAGRQDAYHGYVVAHPILGHAVDLREIASGDTSRLDATVGDKLRTISENITDTVKNVQDEKLKVWNLKNSVALTARDLGVSDNPVLMEAIRERMRQEAADEALVRIAVAALGLTASIVAAVASGGVTLLAQGVAAGAAAVAVGASAYQLSTSVGEFLAESAASQVALDPAIADLSIREPDLFWVVLDLVSFGLDVAAVVAAFGKLSGAVRAAVELGEVDQFAGVAARVPELSPAQAERLTAKVSTIAASRTAGAEVAGASGGQGAIKVTEVLVEGGEEAGSAAALIIRMEDHVAAQNARLAAAINARDAAYLQSVGMSPGQIRILLNPSHAVFGRMYGNAMENAVWQAWSGDSALAGIIQDTRRTGYGSFRPKRPDFVFSGGPMGGFILDLTTPGQRATKLEKYYDRVVVLTYDRPAFAPAVPPPKAGP
jgi:hypothetical protein